jgi:hypothetical protein
VDVDEAPVDSADTGRTPPSNGTLAVASVLLGVVSVPTFVCLGVGAVFGVLAVLAGIRGARDRRYRKPAIAGMALGALGIVLGFGFVLVLIFAPDQTTVRTR